MCNWKSNPISSVASHKLGAFDIIPALTVTLENGNNSIKWLSSSQQSYTLQFSTGLDSWENLNSTPLDGTGAEIQHIHTGASSHPKAFYRLIIN